VFGTTVLIYLLRGNRKQATGVSTGFLFLGAYLSCFHFMYYDVLLSAAALAVLFANPKHLLRTQTFAVETTAEEPTFPTSRELPSPATQQKPIAARMFGYVNSLPLTLVVALFFVEHSLSGLEIEATVGVRYFATLTTEGSADLKVPQLSGNTGVHYPLDTFLLIAMWAWCGWRLVRRGDSPGATSPSGHPAPRQYPGRA
jgi:hypothetical protein